MSKQVDGARLWRAIQDASDDAIYTTDLQGAITSWNAGAARLFGFPASNAVGGTTSVIIPSEREEEEADIVRRIRAGEHIQDLDTLRRRRDGQLIPVVLTVAPLATDDGEVVGTIRIARDGSNREQAERATRRLAAIIESSEDAIVSKDLNGIVTSWNESAERLFGYTSDEIIGRSIRLLIPQDRQAEEDDVLARIRRGDKVDHFETIRQRKDGTLVPISLTVSPIRDRNGVVVGASKIARDITDRKEIEAERARLLRVAEENARVKDDFLATLSHELRTPLNAILGYARMLRSGIVQTDRRERAVETIERNATALTQIVEDVLDVSRIVAGKMRLNVERVDLGEVVRHAVDAVLPAAEAKGIRIDRTVQRDAGPVSGDPDRLQQVVWNLMSNAVKFTPPGGRIEVRVGRSESHAEVAVADNGIGIEPSFLQHIFERFRQADSGTTRERGGLGIGLGLARQLVEMHGGTIHAESAGPGRGSTFRVRLPSVSSDSRAATALPTMVGRGSAAIPQLAGVSVLTVDDDRDALMMLREVVEATGATVFTATSATEALSLVKSVRPDVLVADIAMPRMDGFELIAQIRQSPDNSIASIPAAALTAYARSEDRARALRSGFQLHLAKPIDPAELMAAIAELASRTPTHR